jgi:3-ketosteroid 9alpha-monooxygenase subunit A
VAKRRFDDFEGFPRGWFVVAFSDELPVSGTLQLHYFDRELVAYRGEDGVVRILDGHCPHMGASMGAGGTVVGTSIVCPFHRWRFEGDGRCVEIPYCQEIPKKAAVGTWPVIERNGLVHLWYHPKGGEPEFDVPTLPNHGSSEWLPWRHSRIRIKTHSKEIVENVVDIAHFEPVHGTHVGTFDNEFKGHLAIQRNSGIAYPRGGGKDRFALEATYYGPGFQISDMRGVPAQPACERAHDGRRRDAGPAVRRGAEAQRRQRRATRRSRKGYIDNLTTGFLEDVRIWENKAYRQPPLLCKADGPIMKLRKWYSQFYDAA